LFNFLWWSLRTLCIWDYYAISKSLGKKLGVNAKQAIS
jgi:hypothetical protein